MRRVLILLPLLAITGCKKSEPAQSAAPTLPAHASVGESGTVTVKGVVLERLEASTNAYLRLKTDQGEAWVGVEKNAVKVGETVTVVKAVAMKGWESPSLKRKFEVVYLGQIEGDANAKGGLVPPHPMPEAMAGALAKEAAQVSLPKAPGAEGRTVAEVFAQRMALNGKTVAIHAKVVKVASGITVKGIAGKNWIHLQDGSGKDATNDNDLTVTSDELPAVGDVVTARGPIQANPTIGSGYDRPVLMVGAKFTK